jgi:hypothetical protein
LSNSKEKPLASPERKMLKFVERIRTEGSQWYSSEKNPCEKMPLSWNENTARVEGKERLGNSK